MSVMQDETITVNSRKFDQSIRRTWKCRFLKRNGSLIECIGEFDEEVEHPQLGLIRRGTVSHEYYWLDRWYNVFRFQEPNDKLRNFYCNIAMPPTFENGVLDYVDLDIDVLVWKDFTVEILDREDFERNTVTFDYSDEMKSKVVESLAYLIQAIEAQRFPFDTR